MDLSVVIQTFNNMNVYENRYNSEHYCELVFFSKDSSLWVDSLSTHFGPPQKPSGKAPSHEEIDLAEPFGGIRKNQTLFVKKDDMRTVIAMFWPWSDGAHITLRIAVVVA
jgi:hypothetical protein